jgi:hypothetical protein
VNGDGIPDVVVDGNYDLGIFLGEGAMTFAAPFYIGHSLEPGGTLALDMRGQPAKSGKPDLVVPDFSGAVEVIYNTTQ